MREALDETVEVPSPKHGQKEYGASLFSGPLLTYQNVDLYASQTKQYVTVTVAGAILMVLYISPKTKKDKETKVLLRVN